MWMFWGINIPYARHHNPLLITNRSQTLTIRTEFENKEMDLKSGVKNIQATGYNGARTYPRDDKETLKLKNHSYFIQHSV